MIFQICVKFRDNKCNGTSFGKECAYSRPHLPTDRMELWPYCPICREHLKCNTDGDFVYCVEYIDFKLDIPKDVFAL